jgi:phosphohistidine phosphatase SixA
LSTDGGLTFPISLASGTPNDGEELVALPEVADSGLRVMVQSEGNVFFAVSPTDFRVQPRKSTVIVVRHAEKGVGDDPDLTEAGKRRAQLLARLLSGRRPQAVFSTNTRRTRQTAEPTANAVGVAIQEYADPSQLATTLRALEHGERILVVAHSNTAGPLLNALGVQQQVTIEEDDFDHLFVATVTDAATHFDQLRYGNRPASIGPNEAVAAKSIGIRSDTTSDIERRLIVLEGKIDRILKRLEH